MKLKGSFVALITPFTPKGTLDEVAYRKLVKRQVRAGTSGLVPCGSTGEAATLTTEEYGIAVRIAVEEAGRLPVFAGLATNDTAKAVVMAHAARRLGADGILLLAPYYLKPTQEGLFQHFTIVAKAARLPIIAYNIPGRTAINIEPRTLARIANARRNVIAVKEASGSPDQVSGILTLAPKGFTVMAGDDSMALPMMALGAKGVISVIANIAPSQTARLCSLALCSRSSAAAALHLRLFPLMKALFLETNPIPVKAAMAMMGLARAESRLPLTPITPENRRLLRAQLKKLGLV